jgi:phosphate starvation-inducible protein PhoH and related proteins
MQLPLTHNQCVYLRSLQSTKPILIATGPAGSGKTMLACQEAMARVSKREFDRLIFTRPVVPAGEDLGYLPGDVDDKMAPWTHPLLENCQLTPRVSAEPMGFMRGRTFNDTFIIADEMQNSTPAQMKMLLTRMGKRSKIVILGDAEQSDMEGTNGLMDIMDRVDCLDLEYVDMVTLGNEDIKRHPSVHEILSVYRI